MEISTSFAQLNSTITRSNVNDEEAGQELNAFGIGSANRPELELSPQARILNEIDRVNSARQEIIDEQLSEQTESEEESEDENSLFDNEVFVASTSAAPEEQPALTSLAQRALDLYQSVQNQS